MNTPRIRIKNLTKAYNNQVVFENLNLELDSGNVYFLTKENGSGKTTFFKCLLRECGFKGKIVDQGLVYAYLPEKPKLPKFVSVKAFILMFLDHLENFTFIDKYLAAFKILKYQNQPIDKLSKGTKQKVAIIKTLLSDADVYLFDEPLSGLDQESRKTFFRMISTVENKIIIIATHYFSEYQLQHKKVILE